METGESIISFLCVCDLHFTLQIDNRQSRLSRLIPSCAKKVIKGKAIYCLSLTVKVKLKQSFTYLFLGTGSIQSLVCQTRYLSHIILSCIISGLVVTSNFVFFVAYLMSVNSRDSTETPLEQSTEVLIISNLFLGCMLNMRAHRMSSFTDIKLYTQFTALKYF